MFALWVNVRNILDLERMKLRHKLLKNILIVTKQTRYEGEIGRLGSEKKLIEKGFDLTRIKKSHESHYHSLHLLNNVLKNKNVTIIQSKQLKTMTQDVNDFDLLLTVGGDGTFLEACHYVREKEGRNTRVKLLPINSDPVTSTG